MRIAVIGLGSMGKRRIRLIKELYSEYKITGVDSREDRKTEVRELFGIDTFSSIDDVHNEIDCAFVCTSPLSHAGIINEFLKRGINVFTEINLVLDGYDDNIALANEKGVKLFLSSTFLYREETRYIKSKVTSDRKWNYTYHIGQYLPDWHPWENYKDFFVGDRRTNGCREILAIELPWIISAFGDVKRYNFVTDRITGLNIDYNDNYMILLEHRNGNKGSVVVDVVSPCVVRKLEVYSEKKYLSWNGTPESLMEYDEVSKELKLVTLNEKVKHAEGYASFVTENAYKNEIIEFFDVVLNDKKPQYGFEQDKSVLALIDSMEDGQ